MPTEPRPDPLDLDAVLASCNDPDSTTGVFQFIGWCRRLVAEVIRLRAALSLVDKQADTLQTIVKAATVVGEAMEARIVALTAGLWRIVEVTMHTSNHDAAECAEIANALLQLMESPTKPFDGTYPVA